MTKHPIDFMEMPKLCKKLFHALVCQSQLGLLNILHLPVSYTHKVSREINENILVSWALRIKFEIGLWIIAAFMSNLGNGNARC